MTLSLWETSSTTRTTIYPFDAFVGVSLPPVTMGLWLRLCGLRFVGMPPYFLVGSNALASVSAFDLAPKLARLARWRNQL